MTKDEFWNWVIETKARHWYGKFEYPAKLYQELSDLDSFASDNDIKLTFIVLPHNRDMHDRLIEFGLAEEEAKFKEIITKLNATVIDYDYENEITLKKSNFKDPVHHNMDVARLIIHEVWTRDVRVGTYLTE